jgi:hypothetical protein
MVDWKNKVAGAARRYCSASAIGMVAWLAAVSARAQYQFVDLAPNNAPAVAYGALVTPAGNQQYGVISPSSSSSGQPTDAAIFNNPGGPLVDLGLGDLAGGYVDPSGVHQVGSQQASASAPYTAAIWSGTAASVVSLNPSGWYSSGAGSGYYSPATGSQQVGAGQQTSNGPDQALLWSGSAASVVNLTPSGWPDAGAEAGFVAASVAFQVGRVESNTYHAAVWSGSAASFVDLNPATAVGSDAHGGAQTSSGELLITGDVLYANAPDSDPVVWEGTDPSHLTLVDLFSLVGYGQAEATNGRLVAGDSSSGPFVWDSQTGAVTFLDNFTPSSSFTNSYAFGIDADGDVVGYSTAIPPGGGFPTVHHAVEWVAIPEPSTLAWLCSALAALLCRTKGRRI